MADATTLRQYYYFWAGQKISSAGSSIVSFVIIWWITITTGSAWYLALSSALSFGTMMAVQFLSGYLTDYFDRKRIIVLVDGFQALLTTILVSGFVFHFINIWWLLVILALRGIFDGLHRPATGAILPSMVPDENFQQVNSYDSTASSIINLSSPFISSALIALFWQQIWLVLLLDAVTFVIAIIPMIFISIPSVSHDHPSDSLKKKLFGGITFLKESTGLLPLLFIFAAFNFFLTPVSTLTPIIIYSEAGFASNEFVFALSIAMLNIAMLAMSIVLSRYKINIPGSYGVLLGFLVAISGLGIITYSLYSREVILFLIGNFVIGLGFPIVNIFSSVIWQSQVPPEYQGRVISVRMIVTTASLPISMIAAGIIAELIHFGLLYLVSTIAFASLLMMIWYLTDFQKVDDLSFETTKFNIVASGD